MSPRAAARLETLGFTHVYDYLAGKADWGSRRAPTVLLPVSMKLLGGWNWYLPTWLSWLPKAHVEGNMRRGSESVRLPLVRPEKA